MNKFLALALLPLCLGSPLLEGFGSATEAEIAEIRSGTYLEGFDENPQYSFNYKVADDLEQTYIAREEAREGEEVRGSYSYVDPRGSLVTVSYTAGPGGYQETREVQQGFLAITSKPAGRATGFAGASQAQGTGAASLQAQRAQAARVESQRAEAARLQAQRAEAARIQAQQAEAASLEATEAARLEAQRTQTSSQGNRADLVAQIVSQISSQVPSIVASTVSGARGQVSGAQFSNSLSGNNRGRATSLSGGNRGQVSSSLSGNNRGLQASGSSTVTERFGSSGTHSVSLNTPDVQISYGN